MEKKKFWKFFEKFKKNFKKILIFFRMKLLKICKRLLKELVEQFTIHKKTFLV